MDPATCDFKIPALFGEFMVDLVSISDHGSRENLKGIPVDGLKWREGTPVEKDDGMSSTKRPVPVDPHISLLAIFDLRMINPHDFYR